MRAIGIDPDGVYDPGILNDRLGVKGTMSEFELNVSDRGASRRVPFQMVMFLSGGMTCDDTHLPILQLPGQPI